MSKGSLENGDMDGDEVGRERSSISFPYGDLEDAIPVAKAIHDQGGDSGSMAQIAAWLGHKDIRSGAFRLKVTAAKIFGLVRIDRSGVTLTALGRQVVDPAEERNARPQAFLNVPLYKKIYEKYDGYQLPPDAGLEAVFVNLGVSEKQKSRARQIFQRSAQQAGFFKTGKQRLVSPRIIATPTTPDVPPIPSENKSQNDVQQRTSKHALIEALFETVPDDGAPWDADAREKWLSTAKSILDLIYRE